MMPIFEILLPKMKPNGLFIFGGDREVCRQVEALIGSLDDTLEDEFVLEEMRALKKSGMPFQETFADVADRWTRRAADFNALTLPPSIVPIRQECRETQDHTPAAN